jgi:hypothetical protein
MPSKQTNKRWKKNDARLRYPPITLKKVGAGLYYMDKLNKGPMFPV